MATDEWIAHLHSRAAELLRSSNATESPCPVCKATKHMALPFTTTPWAIKPGDPYHDDGLTLLPILCLSCKHVQHFLISGLSAAEKARQGETR